MEEHVVLLDAGPRGSNSKLFHFSWCDSEGSEGYDRLRPLNYPRTDVVIVAYNCMSRGSFANTTQKWVPEARHHKGEQVPILLVATQIDRRSEEGTKNPHHPPVTTEEGRELAREIGAHAFVETSARLMIGITDLVYEACMAAINSNNTAAEKASTSKKCLMQ